ncbi:MAG: serpin family protein [Planctomycetaceae bacterium]
MTRGIAVAVAVAVSIAGVASGAFAVAVASPVEQATAGVGRLAWDLVRASGPGNAIVSPVSVWEALAMTHAGARGETAAEMARVLGMPDDRAVVAAGSESLRKLCAEAKGEKIVLDVANRIWVQKDKKLEADFTALLAGKFGAGAGVVDFVGATEPARAEINAWVSDHTARKIDELLKAGTITAATRLVLTNAVYLKAPWATKFAKEATRPEPFHVSADTRADVPFMHQSGRLVAGRVGEGPRAVTVCEIPYEGNRLALVVIVPDAVDGLGAVLGGLDGASLAGWPDGAVRPRKVNLALPKWTARKPLGLNEALAALGMKQAFRQGVADFSGMDGTRDLFVSAIVHEGFVEVTEEGTEAAAATGVVVATRAAVAPEEPLDVRADRPFAWAVVERGTKAILFAGVVADPR